MPSINCAARQPHRHRLHSGAPTALGEFVGHSFGTDGPWLHITEGRRTCCACIIAGESPGRDQTHRTGRLDSAQSAGSPRQYKHPIKSGKVTIAGHPSMEMAPKTLKSVLEQAGLKER